MDQDLSSHPQGSLNAYAWSCSSQGVWVPGVSVPKEQERDVRRIFMLHPQNSHGTVSAICYCLRQSQRSAICSDRGLSPQRERTSSSCYERSLKVTLKEEHVRGAICLWPSLENTIFPTMSSLLAQAITLSFRIANLNTVDQSSTQSLIIIIFFFFSHLCWA